MCHQGKGYTFLWLGFTQRIGRGMEIGTVEPIKIVNPAKGNDISTVPEKSNNDPVVCSVNMMNEASTESIAVERKRQLNKLFSQGCSCKGRMKSSYYHY